MTYNYKLTGKHTLPGMTDQDMNFILRKESAQNWAEATWVPKNNENTDYQEYLEWAKTNTAEAAE